MTNVHDDLTIWRYFDMGTVHRSRSRAFEVDFLAVIAATVTGALEFIFGRLPIGGTTQVRAARIDDEKTIWRPIHPDSILLQPFLVDTEGVFRRVPDLENSGRLKQHARQEESEERDEPCCKKCNHAAPDKSAPAAVVDGIGRPDGRDTGCGCRFRGPDSRSPDVLRGVELGDRLLRRRDGRFLSRLAISQHVFHHRSSGTRALF